MKLLFDSLMIFFGTLIAAAVVALGEPTHDDVRIEAAGAVHLVAQTDDGDSR